MIGNEFFYEEQEKGKEKEPKRDAYEQFVVQVVVIALVVLLSVLVFGISYFLYKLWYLKGVR